MPFVLLLLQVTTAWATTIVVDAGGAGDVTTVSEAAELAEDGDRVEIRAGTYYEDGIVFAKGLEIVGDGPDLTFLDGSMGTTGYGLALRYASSIRGVTLVDYSEWAVTVYCCDTEAEAATGHVEIDDVAFTDVGTAVQFYANVWGDFRITRSQVTTAETGVGTYMFSGTLLVEDCVFAETGPGINFGASVWVQDGSTATVVHNTFVDVGTTAIKGYGGPHAIEVYAYNNVVAGSANRAWYTTEYVTGEIANNLIGPDVTEVGVSEDTGMVESDNVVGDPLFVDYSADGDWTNDDLRLCAGSAAIDIGRDGVGTLTTDLGGTARPQDGDGDGVSVPDAGAYEFVYVDADGDGYVDADAFGDDCDDTDAEVHPGGAEVCNGKDDDCDGETDPASAPDTVARYADADLDGFGDPAVQAWSCADRLGWSDNADDCDDGDAAVNPAAVESMADGRDQDCDGLELCATDADEDGWPDPAALTPSADLTCTSPGLAIDLGGDCDDADPAVHPNAADAPGDGVDQDCDGLDAPAPDDEDDDTAPTHEIPTEKPGCGCGGGTGGTAGVLFLGLAVRRRRAAVPA